MLTEIKTITDVQEFTHQLVAEGLTLGFHPDTLFEDYVILYSNQQRVYIPEEAAIRNKLMDQCFEVCERENRDIYEVTGRITLKDTPFETMFDADHEEKYADYMRQVESGERVYGFPKSTEAALPETVRVAYN